MTIQEMIKQSLDKAEQERKAAQAQKHEALEAWRIENNNRNYHLNAGRDLWALEMAIREQKYVVELAENMYNAEEGDFALFLNLQREKGYLATLRNKAILFGVSTYPEYKDKFAALARMAQS